MAELGSIKIVAPKIVRILCMVEPRSVGVVEPKNFRVTTREC